MALGASSWRRWLAAGVLMAALAAPATQAPGGYVTVYGGPMYDPSTQTGYNVPSANGVNDAGTAVGYARKYDAGVWVGDRAVRWDSSGTAATELGNLGTGATGMTFARAFAVNDAGTAVGRAFKYGAGVAVRWDGSGTTATELGNLGTSATGYTLAEANDVNTPPLQANDDAGTAVGWAKKYDAGVYKGERAVRWDGSGTAATELGNLGTSATGYTLAWAYAVNDAGMAVGRAAKYDAGVYKGRRAVRWDGSGMTATELGNLATTTSGFTWTWANDVNDAGTAVGWATKGGSVLYGYRAVRWDGSGTTATELGNLGTTAIIGNLGTSATGYTNAYAYAVNDAGTAVGYAEKYDAGVLKGDRAVRWDGSGTTATELGNLGTDASGMTDAYAYAVNASGTAVGYAEKYDAGVLIGERAVCWGLDGVAVDLNTLIDPASGWTLTKASAISDTDWISGSGLYDPGGAGGLDAYGRLFLMQVPEPATLGLLAAGLVAVWMRKRRVTK